MVISSGRLAQLYCGRSGSEEENDGPELNSCVEKNMVISSGRLDQLHCGQRLCDEENDDLEWKYDKSKYTWITNRRRGACK